MSRPKRKKRSDKFPLTKHPTGQYCKKIKGKLYYFGADKRKALERYYEQAAYLHSGEIVRSRITDESISIKTLCNLFLDYQESRLHIGEISPRHAYDQTMRLRSFAKFVGPNELVSEVSTFDLQSYRRKLAKDSKAPRTINNYIGTVKAMYRWALDNELITGTPRLRAVKSIRVRKQSRPTFTPSQIQALLRNAAPQMKAMIWLGLNCGFGCTDCGKLQWEDLDLQNGRVRLARSKTGVDRNLPLWPEAIKALKELTISGELVFYTRKGNPWVTTKRVIDENGRVKYTRTDNVTQEFSKLMKNAGIRMEEGVGFYTLRRTAATLTARSGDPFAVQQLLGHADLRMATTYVQDVSEQTDRAINNARNFIIPDDSSPSADVPSETNE
jgi:integrase